MTITSYHIKACFEAWMKCEALLVNTAGVHTLLSKKLKIIDECALICMGTFRELKIKSVNVSRYAILCIGICEECAELCEQLDGENYKQCASTCRQCSQTMTSLAPLY